MKPTLEILAANPPLIIFLTIGIGYLLGLAKFRSFSLGVAGVLFTGIFFGAVFGANGVPLKIVREVIDIGLVLFVYAVGLTSGPGFVDAFKERGLKFTGAILFSLSAAALLALIIGHKFGFSSALIAGVYSGSITSTPSLAAVTDLIQQTKGVNILEPALGYSLSYPFAVLGFLGSFQIYVVLQRRSIREFVAKVLHAQKNRTPLIYKNFEVTNPKIIGRALGELRVYDTLGIIISRISQKGVLSVPSRYTVFREGDIVVAIGEEGAIKYAQNFFGRESRERIEVENDKITLTQVLVSNKNVVGKTFKSLDLNPRFNAQVTRLKRADIEIVPSADMTIEFGDRITLVMPKSSEEAVFSLFGNSSRKLAELDLAALTLGISMGVLVGMIPLPLHTGGKVSLGVAGGTLLTGLILGKKGRSGPFVWSIPYEASSTLRNMGIVLFFAGVGLNSGGLFLAAATKYGLQVVFLSMILTVASTALMMLVLRFGLKVEVDTLLGATSGMHTQPASLTRSHAITHSDGVYVAYAVTYPISMIGKILITQFIYLWGAKW